MTNFVSAAPGNLKLKWWRRPLRLRHAKCATLLETEVNPGGTHEAAEHGKFIGKWCNNRTVSVAGIWPISAF